MTEPMLLAGRILVVEDEENARKGYEALLRKWGCDVLGVESAEEALESFPGFRPAAIVADVELPGMNGLEFLRSLGDALAEVPAILITGKGSEERAVQAIESGAFWYIEKPLKPQVLRALLERALGRVRDRRQVAALTRELRAAGRLGELVGNSKAMRDVQQAVEQAAPSGASVLITGETGSGKEMVARALHRLSLRSAGPFVAINCSAIPESLMESEIFGHERGAFTGAAERRLGCFELADGGTLLLDEIGEMPMPTQAKLLRVLEDHKVRRLGGKSETPVDVRHIHLPPLRMRKDDLPALVEALLADAAAKHAKRVRAAGGEVMEAFRAHTWPGNVRELRNVIEHAVIVADGETITRQHLPAQFGRTSPAGPGALGGLRFPIGVTVDEAERALIRQTLEATGNNKTRAAELLGISLKTLHNKLKEYAASGHAPAPED